MRRIAKGLIRSILKTFEPDKKISRRIINAFSLREDAIPKSMSPGTYSQIIPDTLHKDAKEGKFRGLCFVLGEEEMNIYSQNTPVSINLGNPVGVDEQILDGRRYSMWIGLKDLFDTLKEGYEKLGLGQLVHLISPDSTSQ